MKTTSEMVIMFWEDGEPVGFLHENGKREIYKVQRASKEHVAQLFGVNRVE